MRQPQTAKDPLIFAAVTTRQKLHRTIYPPPLSSSVAAHHPMVAESSLYTSHMSDIGYHCFPFCLHVKVVDVFMLFVRSILLGLFATKY
jgi:hypothetical protein